jgi:hypothetical protein
VLDDAFVQGILTDTIVVNDKLQLLPDGAVYPATGTREIPYLIPSDSADISWSSTEPTNTDITIEAQVQGTSTVTDEAVGTGDGATTVFYLDHWPANTPTITVNTVAETGFTLGTDRRQIIFDTAPADTHAILASYTAVDDPVEDAVEIQELDLDSPSGGTFKLGDGTSWTADIAYNASAATIETALEGLYGAGNVAATVAEKDFSIITHSNTINAASTTFSHLYENPVDGDLILITVHRREGALSSISYGGVTPTLIDKSDDDWPPVYIYAITAANQPDTGQSHTLSVTFSGTFEGVTSFTKISGVHPSVLNNLELIVSTNNYVSATNVTTSITATEPYSFVFDAIIGRDALNLGPAASQTTLSKEVFASPRIIGVSYKMAGAGSISMSWDSGESNRLRHVVAGIPLANKIQITFAHSVGNSNLEADFTGLT